MLFSSTFNKVMDGTKTQTRRPCKSTHRAIYADDNETFKRVEVCRIIEMLHLRPEWRCLWEVGRTYAVQPGRGEKSEGRIKITKIRLEKLHDIKVRECFKEGIEVPPEIDLDLIALGNVSHQLGNKALNKFSQTWNTLMFYGMEKFIELWNSIYKGTEFEFEKNPDVWVLEFELVEKY